LLGFGLFWDGIFLAFLGLWEGDWGWRIGYVKLDFLDFVKVIRKVLGLLLNNKSKFA
jgi:hypothetical protein